MENNVPEHPSKAFIFLLILCSIVWFMIGFQNTDSIIGLIFGSLMLGVVSALALTVLYVLMKRMFKL